MTVKGIELEEGDIVGGGDGKPDYRVLGPRSKDSYGGYPLESIFNGHRANLICESAYVLYARKLKSASDVKVGKEYMLVGENVPKEYRGKKAILRMIEEYTRTYTSRKCSITNYEFGVDLDGRGWNTTTLDLKGEEIKNLDITQEAAIPYTPPPEFKVEEGMFVQLLGEYVHCDCLGEFRRIRKVSDGRVYYREEFPERYVDIEGLLSPDCITRLIKKPEPGMVVRLEGTPGHSWGRPDCAGKRAIVIEPKDEFFRCRILEGPKKGGIQILSRGSICSEHWWKYITLLNQTEEEVLKENEPEVTFEAGDVVRCVVPSTGLIKGAYYLVAQKIEVGSLGPGLCLVGRSGVLYASRFEKVETVDEYKGVKVGDEVVLYYGGNFHAAELDMEYMREHFRGNKLQVFKVKAFYKPYQSFNDYYPVLEGPDGRLVTNEDGSIHALGISWCVPVRKIKGLKVKSPRSALEVGSKIVLWNDEKKKFWGGQLTFETIASITIFSHSIITNSSQAEFILGDGSRWFDCIDWCTPIDDVIGLELEEEPPKRYVSAWELYNPDELFTMAFSFDIGGSPPW